MNVEELIKELEKHPKNKTIVLFKWRNSRAIFEEINISPNQKDDEKLIFITNSS